MFWRRPRLMPDLPAAKEFDLIRIEALTQDSGIEVAATWSSLGRFRFKNSIIESEEPFRASVVEKPFTPFGVPLH